MGCGISSKELTCNMVTPDGQRQPINWSVSKSLDLGHQGLFHKSGIGKVERVNSWSRGSRVIMIQVEAVPFISDLGRLVVSILIE